MASGRFKVIDNSGKVKAELNAEMVKKITEACLVAQGGIKTVTPVGKIAGGELRDSIDIKVNHDGAKVIGQVGTPLIYAPYVEFGTGEYAENGSGRKGGWAYKSPDGKWYFTRGMTPRRFMRNGFRQTKAAVQAILGKPIK